MLEFNLVPDEITTLALRPDPSSVPRGTVWQDIYIGDTLVAGATSWFNTQNLNPIALLVAVGLLSFSGNESVIGTTKGTLTTGKQLEFDSDGNIIASASDIGGGGGGGISIGDAIGSGTAGSMLFVDGSGNLGQNNANLFWDSTPATLRIGPSTVTLADFPGSRLNVIDDLNNYHAYFEASGSGYPVTIETYAHRGSVGTPTSSNSGDYLLSFDIYGAASNDIEKEAALISVQVDAAPGSNIVPGRLSSWTADGAGSLKERFRITSKGSAAVTSPDAASTIVTAGQVELQGAVVLMANLPTSDPVKAGQLWSNLGIVTVSAG